MRIRNLFAVAVLGLSGGCNFSGVVGPTDLVYLGAAKSRWESRPFTDYSYEIRTFCFCPPELLEWTRVTVISNVVVEAEHVDPNSNYPINTTLWFHPIDTLFANLHRALSENRRSSPYSDILVDYHPTLGYPRTIEYREKPTVADAASTISVRNVVAINRFTQSAYSIGKR